MINEIKPTGILNYLIVELRLKTANFKVDFPEYRGYLNQAEKQNGI
jgi:hypothetical protein